METGRQNLTVHTLVRLAHKLRVDVLELWKAPRDEPKPTRAGRGRPRKRK